MRENETRYCLVNDPDFVHKCIFYTWLKPKDFFNNYLLSGMCLGLYIVYLTHTKNIQRTAKYSCKIIKNRNLITKTVNYLPEM